MALNKNLRFSGNDSFRDCQRLSIVVMSDYEEGMDNQFSQCSLLMGVEGATTKMKLKYKKMYYWSIETHELCVPCGRKQIENLMMIGMRLNRNVSLDVWILILEFMNRYDLVVF
jgi:hypothetical protein